MEAGRHVTIALRPDAPRDRTAMPPALLRRSSRIGKYSIEKKLGSGSFATVWQARDLVENRRVALKVAHSDVIDEWGPEAVEHEARIASRLSHPNIVTVRNADWIDGRFVMATDLAQKCLADAPGVRRSGRLALGVIRDIAAGLAYAHSKNVLHRDVKPENILLFEDRRAALTDFGVSRFAKAATHTYTEAGTLGYMAPEQAYGRPKLTSDVFSLGLIAYELLTGALPTWPFEWPPRNYDRFQDRVPALVQPILRKAAEFEPSHRYPDAIVLYRLLENAIRRAEPVRRAPRKKPRKKPTPNPSALAVEARHFKRLHGAALGLQYSCHRCDGPISEAMTHCPWCGTSENSLRDVTRYPIYCAHCERGVMPEWTCCPWCYPGRFEANGRKPRNDPRAERGCARKRCQGQLQPFMRYCPICKQKPRRLWSHSHLHDRCPKCRWPVSKTSWRFCPWCGRREPRAGTFSGSTS
jgi:serine/threonine protein kinase